MQRSRQSDQLTDLWDQCHDHCARERADDSIYLPMAAADGLAVYICQRGHIWTCGWGSDATGVNIDNAGKPVLPR